MYFLSPSMLASDYSRLGEEIRTIDEAGTPYIHVDIMDGNFVPSINFGMPVVRAFRKMTDKVLDVHLMVEEPDRYVAEFADCGADIITVHAEACTHLHRTLQSIRALGVKAGVALNPATSLSAVEYVADLADLILVMSVNPGFGGQSFIPSALEKVQRLADLRAEKGYTFEIEIDGGVGLGNIAEVSAAGVDIAVAGSAVYGAEDVGQRVKELVARMG